MTDPRITQIIESLEKLRPLTAYGLVGTRDDVQARLRNALDNALTAARAIAAEGAAQAAAPAQPMAWIVFAPNGNVRLWSTDGDEARKFAETTGLAATPLYAASPLSGDTATVDAPRKLWLWKNFVDGKPEYWAFDNPYPINLDNGDPQTLGEPCGYALLKPSRAGRIDVSEEQVLRAIKAANERDDRREGR